MQKMRMKQENLQREREKKTLALEAFIECTRGMMLWFPNLLHIQCIPQSRKALE